MLKDAITSYEPDLAVGSSPTESYLGNLSLGQPTPPRTKPIKRRKKNGVGTEETGGEDGYDGSDEAEEGADCLTDDAKRSAEGTGKISLLSTNKEATPRREIPEDRSRLRKRNREPEEDPDDSRLARRQKLVRGANVGDDDAMHMSM